MENREIKFNEILEDGTHRVKVYNVNTEKFKIPESELNQVSLIPLEEQITYWKMHFESAMNYALGKEGKSTMGIYPE